MRISRVEIREFDLALARPIVVGGRTLTRRTGLLVIAEDSEGHAGIGEAAPLPGLHRESFDDASAQLLELARAIEGNAVPEGGPALDGAFEAWLGPRGLYPSVRAGLEGAVLSLLAGRAGTDLPHLLARDPAGRVSVNGLLDGEAEAVLEEAARLVGQGFAALKIKVGRRDAAAEARLVISVRERVGEGVELRLDANRAWELPAALTFAGAVAGTGIAYIEEPVRDPADLPAFSAGSAIPVALDETLLGFSPVSPPPLEGVAAFVLKPPVLGGFERAMGWSRLARRAGLEPVVSAAFPSAVGLALEAALAAALGGRTVHGLGTASALAEDLARAPLPMAGGAIDARDLPFRPQDFALERTRVLR